MGRLLGIDYGEKRVGVAISDPTGTIASALDTILFKSKEDLFQQLKKRIALEDIAGVVVGMPFGMKGQVTAQTETVQKFISELRSQLSVSVNSADERLSSVEAGRVLREQGYQPSRNKAMVDSTAAAIILQSYLDGKKL
ncbi:MAG TPA: Holliday junction resolvase RuvX [Candidatus Marinimicrobia bacterium]|jgi:putative Holliday junction resolvase|nr:Holliday junction resolvase RuvX [Candidatus Neomarinimicrobiota bacterium]HIN62228.1 Holliday junction resolvase RuvX [Candidatus Neomarinimicrobiota bacterium]HIO35730.1 Holliday junction resolvase RuvX [Candidatus Neomarinimicrobiota bacterium]HIO56279.1 Holliday junction resolvase RuvX [Candidatus Neomarinimicrobiota bacterium]